MPRLKVPLHYKFLAVFVLTFSLATSLVLLICYIKTVDLMIASTDGLLVSHLQEIVRVAIEKGEAKIIGDLNEEVRELGTASSFFIYKAENGDVTSAGDVSMWSDVLDKYANGGPWPELTETPTTFKGAQGAARVARIRTAQGGIIVGALSLSNLSVLAERYFETGVIAVFVLVVFASLGLYYLLRGVLSQVRAIAHQAGLIESFNTQARLPTTGSGNEFDILAEAINRLLEQLSRSNEAFHQTADHLAHELRTPLSRLRSSAELSLKNNDFDLASETLEQVETMLELTNSMLDLSTLEVDRRVPSPERLNIETIVSQAVSYYGEASPNREIVYVCDQPSAMFVVLGNRSILERIFSNLIDNALKYSHSGPITVSIRATDKNVRVFVTNIGSEVPYEHRSRIFDRFYRAPRSLDSNVIPGFGLGLSFVKAATEAHGGDTWLESTINETTFVVNFPKVA